MHVCTVCSALHVPLRRLSDTYGTHALLLYSSDAGTQVDGIHHTRQRCMVQCKQGQGQLKSCTPELARKDSSGVLFTDLRISDTTVL